MEWGGGSRHCYLLYSARCFLMSLDSKVCIQAPKSVAYVCSSFTEEVKSTSKSVTTVNWRQSLFLLFLGSLSAKVCYSVAWVHSGSPPYCEQFFFHRPHIGHQSLSPTIGFSSIPVLNELHLVSSGSKSHLISGDDSSYSWVFIRALGLWGERSC